MDYKNFLRETLNFLHLDITKNLEYDRLTKAIMKQSISSDSNCIDIGCHKGEILDIMLKLSPKGKHTGFEPIPYLFNDLKKRYHGKATILPYALSAEDGTSKFQLVKNAPAYSGIKQRKYDIENPEIEEIDVELKKLDEVIPTELKIDFVKIDVEGAELGVLKGGKDLLIKNKPLIVFEFGLGASEYYGTTPQDIFNFICNEVGFKIYTLKSFLKKGEPLSMEVFDQTFHSNKEYYFVAYH